MKIALFKRNDEAIAVPAVVTADGFVLLDSITAEHSDPQSAMSFLITWFDELRPEIEAVVESGAGPVARGREAAAAVAAPDQLPVLHRQLLGARRSPRRGR